MTNTLVEVNTISKQFGAVKALRDVTLQVNQGDIHALVGENGAGKSTLGKVISGILRPDAGHLRVGGKVVHYANPHDALADGVTTITQEITLLGKQSVWQNVMLGQEQTQFGFLRKKRMRKRFDQLLELTGFDLDPHGRVGQLNLAEQKKVEVMQAIARNAKLIIMDEPTAMLSDEETAQFLAIIRQLRSSGRTIIYVSHFLQEVLSLADTVTVMRNGEVIRTRPAEDETAESLIEGMLGKSVAQMFPEKTFPTEHTEVAFEVKQLSSEVFEGLSLSVRFGEIVGLAGLVGSGRSRLVRTLFGAEPIKSGTFDVRGRSVTVRNTADAIREGIFLLPESRKEQGLHLKQSLRHNLSLAQLKKFSLQSGFLKIHSERRRVEDIMTMLNIKPALPRNKISSLSGGNQQKALFGKWLFERPTLFIVDEPTRGIDVGAKQAIYRLITELARDGVAILMVSSEIEEILGLSHRALVMRSGSIVAEIGGRSASFNETAIMSAAFGTHKHDAVGA